jgi:hypothetical protein
MSVLLSPALRPSRPAFVPESAALSRVNASRRYAALDIRRHDSGKKYMRATDVNICSAGGFKT